MESELSTQLLGAVALQEGALVAQLLGQGVDPNLTEDGDGVTALHLAAQEKDLGIVKALLAAGGNPHAESVDGHTPIDIAELANHTEMAKLMREFKLSVN